MSSGATSGRPRPPEIPSEDALRRFRRTGFPRGTPRRGAIWHGQKSWNEGLALHQPAPADRSHARALFQAGIELETFPTLSDPFARGNLPSMPLAIRPCCVLLCAVARVAVAGTLHVDPGGADTASCGASGAPCASVQHALGARVTAGDTIVIHPGTYSGELDLTSPSRHSGLTLTTTAEVKAALGTFR